MCKLTSEAATESGPYNKRTRVLDLQFVNTWLAVARALEVSFYLRFTLSGMSWMLHSWGVVFRAPVLEQVGLLTARVHHRVSAFLCTYFSVLHSVLCRHLQIACPLVTICGICGAVPLSSLVEVAAPFLSLFPHWLHVLGCILTLAALLALQCSQLVCKMSRSASQPSSLKHCSLA